jgi:phosphoserine phosphatase RsbU/P
MTRACVKSPSTGPVSLSVEPAIAPSFGEVDHGFEQLRRLTEVSRALTYTTSLDQVTRITVERSAELLSADVVVLMLADAESVLHVRAAVGIDDQRIARFRATLGEEMMVRLQGLLNVPAERVIAVPLVVGGDVTGVLAVAVNGDVTAADEWLLSALADQAAVALENARQGGEVKVEMEERLRVSEGATTAKDRALSTLAHDIRTPLSAIDGYCSILEDEMLGTINDRQRETLGRVRMAGRHLLSLLDNVMEMARLAAGVVQVDLHRVRLGDVAREAVHLLVPESDKKLQTLHAKIITDAIVMADHARLRQVLVNLIGNAVKFTAPDGGISVAIHVDTAGDEHWGCISVTDTGPGIPSAELKAVFEPYYRSAGAERTAGVGLGLAISHALVERMAGRLDVESEPGHGSCFVIRLPLIEN